MLQLSMELLQFDSMYSTVFDVFLYELIVRLDMHMLKICVPKHIFKQVFNTFSCVSSQAAQSIFFGLYNG